MTDNFAHPDAHGPTILTVPGLGGSGPAHWQSLWEGVRPDTVRAELGMWDTPHCASWVTKLDEAIRHARAPVILVAHSLGCLAVAWWAQRSRPPHGGPVAGALLVAPPDVDRPGAPAEVAGFAPAPCTALPFPSILVASSGDPWVDLSRARGMAADWGSHFIDAGAHGHLNVASGLGLWPEGQELLDRVIAASSDGDGRSRAPDDARAVLNKRGGTPPPRG